LGDTKTKGLCGLQEKEILGKRVGALKGKKEGKE